MTAIEAALAYVASDTPAAAGVVYLHVHPGPNEVFVTFAPKIRPPVSVRFVPATPRAGKSFRAVGKNISCRATLAGRKLRRGCRWPLPKAAHGKRLVVTVSNSAGRSRKFVFKVR